MTELEAALGHAFSSPSLLAAALVHRSYSAEHPEVEPLERLEFLGDAVLQMVVTDFLYRNCPGLLEGQMAMVRAASVNGTELAEVAAAIGLGPHLLLGRGEASSEGQAKDSILADAMEAVLAAVYLDGGWEAATRVILHHWSERLLRAAEEPGRADYKTRLQEVLAAEGRRPEYRLGDTGPDHDKVFQAEVRVDGRLLGEGQGGSKKEAQQAAAKVALDALGRS